MLNLEGKTAIVTGGSKGIGLAIVKRMAESGANVVMASRNLEESQNVVEDLKSQGFDIAAIKTDVSDENSVKRLVDETVKKFGSIEILVNNAGIFPIKTLSEMESEDFNHVISVNLNSVFLCIKYVSEAMISRGHGGNIVNITSIDTVRPSMVGLSHL